MTMLGIRAVGGDAWPAADARNAAVSLLKAARKRPRRTNRFIDIALAGAVDCCRQQELPNACGIYLATRHGDAIDTREEILHMQNEHRLPMPVAFINLSGNIAGFYIANALKVTGPNVSLSADQNVFLRALELAALDLESGVTEAALVGQVDDTAEGASSHWLLLAAECVSGHVLVREPLADEASGSNSAASLVEAVRAGETGFQAGSAADRWRLRQRG